MRACLRLFQIVFAVNAPRLKFPIVCCLFVPLSQFPAESTPSKASIKTNTTIIVIFILVGRVFVFSCPQTAL